MAVYLKGNGYTFRGGNSLKFLPPFRKEVYFKRKEFAFSEEANRSGSPVFLIQDVNLCQQSRLGNLIDGQLEMGMAS